MNPYDPQQAQQQWMNQQLGQYGGLQGMYQNISGPIGGIIGTTTATNAIPGGPVMAPAKKAEPVPETALAWLDRRVAEMRVSL